jgi:hypothetical protein
MNPLPNTAMNPIPCTSHDRIPIPNGKSSGAEPERNRFAPHDKEYIMRVAAGANESAVAMLR